jgi:hypothetical protein
MDRTNMTGWAASGVALTLAALLAVSGFFGTYDGRSTTQRVSECLAAAGYSVKVSHDDGTEPLGGSNGLLGPLGDYQAGPPSDLISVTLPDLYEVAVVTVQDGRSHLVLEDVSARQARSIRRCAL